MIQSYSMTEIYIPASVKEIEAGAFAGCSSMRTITVSSTNESYESIDGSLYTKGGDAILQYAIGKADTAFVIFIVRFKLNSFCDCFLIKWVFALLFDNNYYSFIHFIRTN